MQQQKQIVIFFIFFIFSLSISSIAYAQEVEIKANGLNLRSGPGLDYDVVGQANDGEVYPLIKKQAAWIAIMYRSETAWVAEEYVSVTDEEETAGEIDKEPELITQTIMTKYQETNIRSQPSTEGTIIATIPQGEVLSSSQTKNNWLKIEWENEEGFIPSWLVGNVSPQPKATASVFQNKVIVIDAGHGGRDVGAIGASGNYEKNYTLRTAGMIKAYLEQLGATVYLTRNNDQYYTLTGRSALANEWEADIFLSLHYNSTPQYPNAKGISTYYYAQRDQVLANVLHKELLKSTLTNDRSASFGDYQVLRTNHRPSVLLELGFISNVGEEMKIQSIVFQRKISQGVIAGLQKYFSFDK